MLKKPSTDCCNCSSLLFCLKCMRELHPWRKNLRLYSSIIKQKGRISKRVFQENKAPQIFRKTDISCAYQGARNVRFLENWACVVFLKHPFWDSPFCLITDALQIRLEHTLTQKFNSIRHFGWSEHSKKTGSKVDYSKKLVERRRWVF